MCDELAASRRGDVPLVAVATLVGWLVCAVVGVLGLVMRYGEPTAIVKAVPSAPVEAIQVDAAVHAEPREAEQLPAPAMEVPLPTKPEIEKMPAAPAEVAVAASSAAISFALPVAGMTHVVAIGEAAHGGRREVTAGATETAGVGSGAVGAAAEGSNPNGVGLLPPAVKHLTLGEGEGRQPAPEYPRQAVIARQEGTVGLEFEVDEGGIVTDARITTSSRWPLLNQAALRAVKQRWKFSPGARRSYDVLIQFQLEQ